MQARIPRKHRRKRVRVKGGIRGLTCANNDRGTCAGRLVKVRHRKGTSLPYLQHRGPAAHRSPVPRGPPALDLPYFRLARNRDRPAAPEGAVRPVVGPVQGATPATRIHHRRPHHRGSGPYPAPERRTSPPPQARNTAPSTTLPHRSVSQPLPYFIHGESHRIDLPSRGFPHVNS